jgi:hypothetical protein
MDTSKLIFCGQSAESTDRAWFINNYSNKFIVK